jgi:TP901 family phage tail tape measure protein
MFGSDQALNIVIKARDEASRVLKEVEQGAKNLAKTMEQNGKAMREMGTTLSASLTAPIVGLGALSLKTAGDYQLAMNRVRAVSGATGDDFVALQNQAKDLGRTTQFTASQAADAMGFLAMAGFKANEVLGAMPGTLQLAASAQIDLGQAADIVSNILTGYGMEVEQLGRVNDVLVKSFTSANTDLTQLGVAFKYAGPVAKSAGIEFEEAAAALGLMGNAGIQASMAGTSLRGAVVRLLKPTAEVNKALGQIGLTADELSDGNGGLRPLVDIVELLEERGANTAQMMAIFGLRAGPAMEALVSQGSSALRELTHELENAGGTAETIAGVQMEGFNGSLLKMKSAWEGVLISFAESGIMDTVASMLEGLAVKLQNLAAWWENLNPKMQKAIVGFALVVAAIGPILLVVGQFLIVGAVLIKTLLGLGTVFVALVGGAKLLGTALTFLALNPVGILVTAIAIAAIIIIKHWSEVKETWRAIAAFLGESITAFVELWRMSWDGIYSFFSIAISNIKVGWETTWNGVLAFFSDVWTRLKTTAKDGVNGMIGLAEGMANGWVKAVNTIIGALNKIKVSIPDWVPGMGGKSFGINLPLAPQVSLPRLEFGGIIPGAPGTAVPMIGHAGERVIPRHQVDRGGANIVVTINNPQIRNNNDITEMRRQIEMALRDVTRQYKMS